MKIVFNPVISPAAWAIGMSLLPPGFDIEVLDGADRDRRIAQLEGADFLMGFLRGMPLGRDDYPHLKQLKLIQLLSAGYDNIDLDALRASGIPLANNGGANSYAVSEHAILLMLAVSRRLPALDAMVRAGRWKSSKLGEEQEHEIAGKTIGLIGAGMIGRTMARRLQGFEVDLIYFDPVRLSPADEASLSLRFRPLDDVLREADIVSLHAPNNTSTHRMINDRTLAMMKRDAILINTARGELVDEDALYRALRDGTIQAAGLDAFDQEPPSPDNKLFTLANVVLSPHAAGPTWESWPKRFGNSYANIERVARGETPLWVVPELRR